MCLWACKSDSRYPESWELNPNGDPVKFFHFPGAVRQNKRRQKGIKACHRSDLFVGTKDSYICSLHLVGGSGLTEADPDPISAVASEEMVCLSICAFTRCLLFEVIFYTMLKCSD